MVLLKNPSPGNKSQRRTIIIRDCKIFLNGTLQTGSILIHDGKIAKIARHISAYADESVQARGLLAIPGLVDAHVHLRDMDLSYKEDFSTGTAAAAAGGVTTVLDMPNTVPPTDSSRRLKEKIDRAREMTLVNLGFHAAAVANETAIKGFRRTGAFSLKLYMPKPISPLNLEGDIVIAQLMKAAARNSLPMTVHAEEPHEFSIATETPQSFSEFAASRSPKAETAAVSRLLRLQKMTNCPVHFCHLTLSSSIAMIARETTKASIEVTPHHLLLSKKWLEKKKWKAWMVPPLRSEAERRKLLSTTAGGHVTTIGSDHAPHAIGEKNTVPERSPPGIPGLETTLPLLLTMLKRGAITLSRIISLTSFNPARVFGLASKGRLAVGKDADIVLVDLKKRSRIDPGTFQSKAKFSPFEGMETQGSVHTTLVAGRTVYAEGRVIAKPGEGQVLEKK